MQEIIHILNRDKFLIAIDKIDSYKEENKKVVILKQDDLIKCQPNVKH